VGGIGIGINLSEKLITLFVERDDDDIPSKISGPEIIFYPGVIENGFERMKRVLDKNEDERQGHEEGSEFTELEISKLLKHPYSFENKKSHS
jgi:hypothetical protein